MKNLLLTFGIALVSLTNVCNAKNTVNNDSVTPFHVAALNDGKGAHLAMSKPILNEDIEFEVFDPETIIGHNRKTVKETIAEGDEIIENTISDDLDSMVYEETMKEIIAQSDLIIENTVSNETYCLNNVRTLNSKIENLEMIIESNVTNEVKPLDFKKINNSSIVNAFNS